MSFDALLFDHCVGDVSFPHFIQIYFVRVSFKKRIAAKNDVKKTAWDVEKRMPIVNDVP